MDTKTVRMDQVRHQIAEWGVNHNDATCCAWCVVRAGAFEIGEDWLCEDCEEFPSDRFELFGRISDVPGVEPKQPTMTAETASEAEYELRCCVEEARVLGVSWTQIAAVAHVEVRTVRAWCANPVSLGMTAEYLLGSHQRYDADVVDESLDALLDAATAWRATRSSDR